MVQITRIDNNLNIYRENKIVVLGSAQKSLEMVAMLDINDISVDYVCNDGFNSKSNIKGVRNISFDEVTALCDGNVIVQLADPDTTVSQTNLPPEKVITHSEAVCVIIFLEKLKERVLFPHLVKGFQNFKKNKTSPIKEKVKQSILNSNREPVLLLTPPKTGCHTFMKTFAEVGQPFHMMWHSPDIFLKDEFLKKDTTFKIITAVREPISRDLSSMYQGLEFMVSSPMIDVLDLHEHSPHFLTKGGDAQVVFDLVFNSKDGKNTMDEFLLDFKENILDLLAYPFDKEKGYTIIKEGKIEVFVYQLEKLNSLLPELSDWLGTNIDVLQEDNTADKKWTSTSYNQAKKFIKIDQEYFDKCYSSEWINHFYSELDISRFKENWRKNIK